MEKFPYYRDKYNNVLITKKRNKKSEETIILQGHLDMVCIKDNDENHNFEKDGIQLLIQNNIITANKTTLGADNGVAVAMMLTILESNISHPNLECLFTTDEEEGMTGIKNFDFKRLKGKYYINLDNETESEIIIGSAGGITGKIYQYNNKYIKNTLPAYQIEISNLHGGHSGVEIDKGYWNSNLLMANILENISNNNKIYISEFIGGEKNNAISNHTRCIIQTDKKDLEKKIKEYINKLEFVEQDKNIDIKIKLVNITNSYCEQDSKNIIKLLTNLKQNVIFTFDNQRPSTSVNVGMVKISNYMNEIHFLIRSTKESELKSVMETNTEIAKAYGYACSFIDSYPIWEPVSKSLLLEKYKQAYKNSVGKDIDSNIIHAGLECCIAKQKIKNIDIISIGPNIKNVHTTKEELEIIFNNNILKTLINLLKEW